MNVTISNLSDVAVPVGSSEDGGLAFQVPAGESVTLNRDAIWVAVIGDKPGFLDQLKDTLDALHQLLIDFIIFWRNHNAKDEAEQVQEPVVYVVLENHGPNALRVLLGSNVDEHQVNAGDTFEATSPAYIEVRELGVGG